MKVIIYSYPRSGSCWIRYIVNVLMQWGLDRTPENKLTEKAQKCIKIHHFLPKYYEYLKEDDKFITIIRNYKECIVRNNLPIKNFNIEESLLPQSTKKNHYSYIHPIQFYEENNRNKIILYYEDLIVNPIKNICKIANLLNVDCRFFIDNLEHHIKKSLERHPTKEKNETHGKKTHHYIYRLGEEKSKIWDELIETKYPKIYDKYLIRYKGFPQKSEIDRHDTFIGRWVTFHKGHLEIIKKVYQKNNRPILILVMNTDEHPLAYYRKIEIQKVLDKYQIPFFIQIIPPIASVNWGRNVGYETNYIEVDQDIQKISNTNIQQKIKNQDNSWKNDIP